MDLLLPLLFDKVVIPSHHNHVSNNIPSSSPFTFLTLYESSNSSTNNSTSSSICDPLLFKLGDLSREGNNASVVNNICPDSIFTPIFSGIFIFFYLLFVCFGIIGVLWKRNSSYVRARNPVYMILTISASLFFVMTTCLRFIIGRKIFPCFLYTISFFVIAPALCLPTVFRCIRIYLMYKINLEKSKVFDLKSLEKSGKSISVRVDKQMSMRMSTRGNAAASSTSTVPSVSSELNLMEKKVVSFEGNQNSESTTPKELSSNSSEISKVEKGKEMRKEDSEDDSQSWITSGDADFTETILHDKKFKAFSLLVSYKFIVIVYIIGFFIHLCIWAILGGVDEASFSSTGKRIFIWKVSMFAFDSGCITTSSTIYLLAAEAAFYIIVEIAFVILLFLSDRDTWLIKRETIVLIVIQIILAIAYLVSGQIEVVRFLTDYFVPFGYTLLIYSLIEIFISVDLPIIYSIYHDWQHLNSYAEFEIEMLLKNRKTFIIILDYARRSYCTEDILAFRDIEKFRTIAKRHKKKVALKILKTYLKEGSSLELNISNIKQRYDSLENILNQATDPSMIPSTLFDEIKFTCMQNLIDVVERLKVNNKAIQEAIENWKRTMN